MNCSGFISAGSMQAKASKATTTTPRRPPGSGPAGAARTASAAGAGGLGSVMGIYHWAGSEDANAIPVYRAERRCASVPGRTSGLQGYCVRLSDGTPRAPRIPENAHRKHTGMACARMGPLSHTSAGTGLILFTAGRIIRVLPDDPQFRCSGTATLPPATTRPPGSMTGQEAETSPGRMDEATG